MESQEKNKGHPSHSPSTKSGSTFQEGPVLKPAAKQTESSKQSKRFRRACSYSHPGDNRGASIQSSSYPHRKNDENFEQKPSPHCCHQGVYGQNVRSNLSSCCSPAVTPHGPNAGTCMHQYCGQSDPYHPFQHYHGTVVPFANSFMHPNLPPNYPQAVPMLPAMWLNHAPGGQSFGTGNENNHIQQSNIEECIFHGKALPELGCSLLCRGRISKQNNPDFHPLNEKKSIPTTELSSLKTRDKKSEDETAAKSSFESAAVLIQKHIRGYQDRVFIDKNVIPVFLQSNRLASNFVDSLMEEFLREEFIPDLLIDILTQSDDPYTKLANDDFQLHEALGSITNEVVNEMITELVKGTISSNVNDYLRRSLESKKHPPLMLVIDDICNDFLNLEVASVVREGIREMVSDYLQLQAVDQEFEQIVDQLIDRVAMDSLTEYEFENDIDLIIEEVLGDMCKVAAYTTYEEMSQLSERVRCSKDIVLLSNVSQSIIRDTMLRMLLSTVATRGEPTCFRHELHLFLKKMVAEMLIHMIRRHLKVQHVSTSRPAFQIAHKLFASRATAQELLSQLDWVLQEEEQTVDEEDLDRLLGQ